MSSVMLFERGLKGKALSVVLVSLISLPENVQNHSLYCLF